MSRYKKVLVCKLDEWICHKWDYEVKRESDKRDQVEKWEKKKTIYLTEEEELKKNWRRNKRKETKSFERNLEMTI